MKKSIFYLFLFLLIGEVSAQDAQSFSYRNAIKISPFEFGNSEFQLTYEKYSAMRRHSILIMPTVILKDNGVESKKGVEGMIQYRFFLTHLKKGKNKTWGMSNIGFYTGTYLRGLIYSEVYQSGYYDKTTNEYLTKNFEKDIRAAEGGVLLGIQFDITTRIILDMYVGGGVRYSDVEDSYDDFANEEIYRPTPGVFDKEYTGVKPKVGLQIGFTF